MYQDLKRKTNVHVHPLILLSVSSTWLLLDNSLGENSEFLVINSEQQTQVLTKIIKYLEHLPVKMKQNVTISSTKKYEKFHTKHVCAKDKKDIK